MTTTRKSGRFGQTNSYASPDCTQKMNTNHFGFTNKELRKLRSLKNPYGIQRFLDDIAGEEGESRSPASRAPRSP